MNWYHQILLVLGNGSSSSSHSKGNPFDLCSSLELAQCIIPVLYGSRESSVINSERSCACVLVFPIRLVCLSSTTNRYDSDIWGIDWWRWILFASVAAAERKSRFPTSGPIPGILGCSSGTSEKSFTFPTLRFCLESSSALTKIVQWRSRPQIRPTD